jgi:excisionase family DNA binding protein
VSTTEHQPEYLSVREVAELLGVSVRTAYTLVTSGEIPAVRVRSLWRIQRTALEQHLARTGATDD